MPMVHGSFFAPWSPTSTRDGTPSDDNNEVHDTSSRSSNRFSSTTNLRKKKTLILHRHWSRVLVRAPYISSVCRCDTGMISGSHNNTIIKSKAITLLLLILCLGNLCSSSSFTTSPLFGANNKIKMGKQQTATSESSPLINNGHNNGNGGDVHSKIAAMRQLMQETHKSRVNFSFEWRKTQLSKLSGMVEENFDLILKAVQQDLGKNATEATVFEIGPFRAEVAYMLANTHRLMQPQDK